MRMRRFTLLLLVAFCSLMGYAEVGSVDDLVGVYSVKATGNEYITNYTQATSMSRKTYTVEISKNADGTVTVYNLLNFSSSLVGTVDLAAKTITLSPGMVSWATFASSATPDGSGSVVADFTDDGVITVHDFGGWIYETNYISDGAQVVLTMSSITKDWSVEGGIAYNDLTTNTDYYKGRTTLAKYSGSDDYDYILKCDEYAAPKEIQFKVADGKISITNGYQTAGYSGAYFYYIYPDNNYVWLDTTDGYATFSGDETGGELRIYCYNYNTSDEIANEGYMSFTWGTLDGIASPSVGKTVKDAPIYDLSGRRVSKPTAGIYIQNGKKFVVK